MPSPPIPWRCPSPDEVTEALDVLDEVYLHLRDAPSVPHALPMLAKVLDDEYGALMILGNILRATATLIEGHALLPWPVEIRHIIARLRAAAPEVTDCHDLHRDVQRLSVHAFQSADPPDPS
ncbi:hypothetical protein [Streptomyces sp. NPDC001604]|uniref:hypothetical protein n=1 Tax=Streptomyces sp. NPDC001604 TaxID=3364593 RepID=UPI0036875E07